MIGDSIITGVAMNRIKNGEGTLSGVKAKAERNQGRTLSSVDPHEIDDGRLNSITFRHYLQMFDRWYRRGRACSEQRDPLGIETAWKRAL